jgi:hypothetical protein
MAFIYLASSLRQSSESKLIPGLQGTAGDPTLLHYSIIAVVATLFGFEAETFLLDQANKVQDKKAVFRSICRRAPAGSQDLNPRSRRAAW